MNQQHGSRVGRAQAAGPLGCLLGILLLPVVVISSLAMVVTTWWRLRKMRSRLEGVGAQARRASPSSQRETALCTYVRGLALDPVFSREEALEVPVVAEAGLGATELLDEAIHRGWVVSGAGGLRVSDSGRDAADRYLARDSG